MRSRWIALFSVALLGLAACGDKDADPADSGATDGDVAPVAERTLPQLGEFVDWDDHLRIRVSAVGIDHDNLGPWLTVAVKAENTGPDQQPMPAIELSCDQNEGGARVAAEDAAALPRVVPPNGSVEFERLLTVSGDTRTGDPIPTCIGEVTVPLTLYVPADQSVLGSPGWSVPADIVEDLNAARPTPGPTAAPHDAPKDPDRPYAWVGRDELTSGYQVVVVPGMTTDEALRILDPVRGAPTEDDYERVVVAEHEDGVVLFTYWFVADRYVRALSRGGVAASYGNTVEGDDHILVARDGKVVRSFDPFMGDSYDGSKPLPEEKDLDLADDTWAASWTLLERITGIHITEGWLLDQDHPGFRLRD